MIVELKPLIFDHSIFAPASSLMSQVLSLPMRGQLWEEKESILFSELASQAELVVDIGANYGYYSYLAVKAGAVKVIAVEPVPELAESIAMTVSKHELPIRVYNFACSDFTGETVLHRSTLPDHSTLLDTTWFMPVSANKCVCKRLDDVLNEVPDLIKIDVEGLEKKVLQGATSLLNDHDAKPAILIEYTVGLIDFEDSWIPYVLEHTGYNIYDLDMVKQNYESLSKWAADASDLESRNFLLFKR